MLETEITVEVYESFESADAKLKEKGYVLVETFILRDSYFSKYSIAELLKKKYSEILASSLLVRMMEDDNGVRNILIYKDKKVDDQENVINEEKVSTKIDSPDKAKTILSSIGLTNWENIDTYCYLYKKEEKEIVIQIIEELGVFIEYEEDETMSNLNPYEKQQYMYSVLKDVGLNIGDDLSCKKVYMKFLKDNWGK